MCAPAGRAVISRSPPAVVRSDSVLLGRVTGGGDHRLRKGRYHLVANTPMGPGRSRTALPRNSSVPSAPRTRVPGGSAHRMGRKPRLAFQLIDQFLNLMLGAAF